MTIRVAGALCSLGVPYLVGGSIASSLLGVPRATFDVDMVADLRPWHVMPLISALENDFYLEEGSIRDAIDRRSSFNVIDLATMLKVDIFVSKDDPLSLQEMERRMVLTLPGDPPASLVLATPEDIIIQKLVWYRLGHGIADRQWGDVLGVLRVQGQRIDMVYLHRWAADAEVMDLLEQATAEAAAGMARTPRPGEPLPGEGDGSG